LVVIGKEGFTCGGVEPEDTRIVSGETIGVFEGEGCLADAARSIDGHEEAALKLLIEGEQVGIASNKELIARERDKHKRRVGHKTSVRE
jgi:hypothetical protein